MAMKLAQQGQSETVTADSTEAAVGFDEQAESEVSTPSPGEHLQQARIATGLSVDALAEELKIVPSRLVALEADQYEKLPRETFIRGYIRSYAKRVGLDPEQEVGRYSDYMNAVRETTVQVVQVSSGSASPVLSARMIWMVAAALGIMLVLSFVFWFTGLKKPEASALQAVVQVSEAAQLPLSDELTAADLLAAEAASIEQNKAPALEAPGAVESALSSLDQLAFEFSADCWVEVVDANGDVLFADSRNAGDTLNLEGLAPFNVMLGNAATVTLLFNETPVDTLPSGNGRAKRFSVGS